MAKRGALRYPPRSVARKQPSKEIQQYISAMYDSPSTRRVVRDRLHELERFVDCRLLDVTPEEIEAYLEDLDDRHLTLSTRRLVYYALRKFLKWANDAGLPTATTPEQVPKPQGGEEDTSEDRSIARALTPEEFADILVYLDERMEAARANAHEHQQNLFWVTSDTTTERNRLILSLMYYCGISLGDVLRLKRDDVHDGVISIKRRYATQEVPVPRALMHELTTFMAEHDESPYVFYGESSTGAYTPHQPLHSSNTHHLLTQIAEEFGWDRKTFVPESFRKSFAMNLLRESGSLEAVRKALGLRTRAAAARYLE